uniref:Uncharacterized protein n=1 Tax=Arundo donax TaxID=35708 RepID=A0A0A9H3M0_ARUDO
MYWFMMLLKVELSPLDCCYLIISESMYWSMVYYVLLDEVGSRY